MVWENTKTTINRKTPNIILPGLLLWDEVCACSFPTSVFVQENGASGDIRTFLDEKYVCRVQVRPSIACISSSERWVNSWRKQHWIVSNSALWFSKPQKVNTRIREKLWMASMKHNSSAGWWMWSSSPATGRVRCWWVLRPICHF